MRDLTDSEDIATQTPSTGHRTRPKAGAILPRTEVRGLSRLFDQLARLTPCLGMDRDAVATAIAEVHVELILIHPFREGNGRIARLVADVMAAQAGLGPLDYTVWEKNKEAYFAAIQAGLDRDYEPMGKWVRRALDA